MNNINENDIQVFNKRVGEFLSGSREILNIKEDINRINGRIDKIDNSLKNMNEVVAQSVSKAVEDQFKRIDEKIEEKMLSEFDRRELDGYRKRDAEMGEYKKHTVKTVIQWVVVGVLGIVSGAVVATTIFKSTGNTLEKRVSEMEQTIINQKEVIEDYERHIKGLSK